MSDKPRKELRRGWTTGACATAALKAAYGALLTSAFPDPVCIRLPRGQEPYFALASWELKDGSASASIIKDAGDDPDVTHLAEIRVRVRRLSPNSGIIFRAGPGVGTVTKPGLPISPGQAAINPVPRAMMREVVEDIAKANGAAPDAEVEISIPGGEALAQKTWNPRLGIVGGLSILGTTGIVVPFSCSAWIHSIHRGIDVARANGLQHVAGCTGSTSEAAVRTLYDLPVTAMLDMGDFAGGLLKYFAKNPLPRLTIAGGFGKISKLAKGHMDLHSGRSQVDFNWLAERIGELGGSDQLQDRVRKANTAKEVLDLALEEDLPLADSIAALACQVAGRLLSSETQLEVLIFDRNGAMVGSSND
ncbi:MAG: cobalt-precorrin-5B (C(1))-methyltransferase [Kiloniellales bacterium]|nr:cobalt-precorrin-5B (C(1))-methyltransferase [Kiloniellales bacterium]